MSVHHNFFPLLLRRFPLHIVPIPAFRHGLLAVALFALTIALGYFTPREQFVQLIALYGLFAGLYLLACRWSDAGTWPFYRQLGILLRLALLFSVPGLSNDVYRFIWDGRLLLQGVNPLLYTPLEWLESGKSVPGLDWTLFAKLNSGMNYTIYPPVAQAVFWLSCLPFSTGDWAPTVLMRALLIAGEYGVLRLLPVLLPHFGYSPQRVVWYALNPLIIMEITGNLHFEGLMIFFLLWSMQSLLAGKMPRAALAMSLSIATKLLPLMLLPFLLRRLNIGQNIRFFGLLGVLLALMFLPMLGGGPVLAHFGNSLDLYFQQFEFNAGIYYIARWIGYRSTGYNQIDSIGPTLALCTTLYILLTALWETSRRWEDLPDRWLLAGSVYLFFAAIVHPWYLVMPIVLSLFTRRLFPLVWSALIFLSYIHYSYTPYRENWYVLGLEYGLLAIFMTIESFLLRSNKPIS